MKNNFIKILKFEIFYKIITIGIQFVNCFI